MRTSKRIAGLTLTTALLSAAPAAADYCAETPTSHAVSASRGSPSRGKLEGGVRLVESDALRQLPARHKGRCIDWGTRRLVEALARAGEQVRRAHPGSPPLGLGNLSRARGGPIREYSHSHQSGRDADLAFYALDAAGQPVAADDLTGFTGKDLKNAAGQRLDAARTWTLARALLTDPEIEVRWLFVSEAIRGALLEEARRRNEPRWLRRRAEQALHQPSDAPDHDDHIHMRIGCTPAERKRGCKG